MKDGSPVSALGAVIAVNLVCLAAPAGSSAAQDTNAWRTVKMEHFVVLHRGNEAFAERMGRRAEDLFERIMKDLGYTQRDRFWLWDNRCTIRVHSSAAEFRSAVRAPEWAGGCADAAKREITTFAGSDAFVEHILPHELTHLVFREFIGFKEDVPLWLNEGVAVWESSRLSGRRLPEADADVTTSLAGLAAGDMRAATPAAASNIYARAAGAVGFLFDQGGAEKFATFCRRLRDGKSVDDALRFTYGPAMGNMVEIEQRLRADREERQKR